MTFWVVADLGGAVEELDGAVARRGATVAVSVALARPSWSAVTAGSPIRRGGGGDDARVDERPGAGGGVDGDVGLPVARAGATPPGPESYEPDLEDVRRTRPWCRASPSRPDVGRGSVTGSGDGDEAGSSKPGPVSGAGAAAFGKATSPARRSCVHVDRSAWCGRVRRRTACRLFAAGPLRRRSPQRSRRCGTG